MPPTYASKVSGIRGSGAYHISKGQQPELNRLAIVVVMNVIVTVTDLDHII